MRNYIFILLLMMWSTNGYPDEEYYRKNVQEVPPIWKKVANKKARIYLHPGGKLPGYFTRKMKWVHLKKGLSKEEIKKTKAFVVFNTSGPTVAYIDLKYLRYIFYKNKKWDTYDLVKMLKLGAGEIVFDKDYEPLIMIGNQKIKYDLPRWQVDKLYSLIAQLLKQKNIQWDAPQFGPYLQRVIQHKYLYPHEDMDEEKFFFVLHSINQAYRVFQRTPVANTPLPIVSPKNREHNAAYAFSLIAFKKGDLDKFTPYIMKNGIEKGFTKMALFFPIYYSGGSTRYRKLPRKDGRIIHGKHYFYEDIFAIDSEELKRCLAKVWRSGLSFTFVPHLESIHTLNRIWESSWRIHSEIPLDEEYFERAFATLFASIRENKHLIQPSQEIRIVVASEIDPAFITETYTSYQLIKTLQREIKLCGLKDKQIKLVWNPNGDFLHGWHNKQNKPDYDLLVKIFEQIDSISPSLYEQHQHIVDGSYQKSRDKFRYSLIRMLHRLMAGRNLRELVDRIYKIIEDDFSIGEFGLKDEDSATSYVDFHQEFRHCNPNGVMILWNLGRWDHANITGMNPGKYERQIDRVLQISE